MRNSTMRDKLSTAIKRAPATGLSPTNKEEEKRIARIRASFRPSSHKFALAAAQETAVAQVSEETEPQPKILQMPEATPREPAKDLPLAPHVVVVAEPPAEIQYIAPDLQWLGKPTPFAQNLNPIVGRLKDAKARVATALEFALKAEKEKETAFHSAQATLEHERTVVSELRVKMAHIEDVIAGCALLAEQSVEVEDLLIVPTKSQNGEQKRPYARPTATDPTVCRYSDVLAFFEQNRGMNWATREIIAEMPPIKQTHAKKSIGQILYQLCTSEGKIERVQFGVYRMP